MEPSDDRPGTRMWRAPTRAQRSAAARALLTRRARVTRACEFCGEPFETYASGNAGRFCSRAHQARAYREANRERLRELARAWHRRRAARPTEVACWRCGKAVPVPPTGTVPRYCGRSCQQLAWVARLEGEALERHRERERRKDARRRAVAKARRQAAAPDQPSPGR